MKMMLKGSSTEGKVIISLVLGLSIGILSMLYMVSNDSHWKSLNESIIWSNQASYARGCTEMGNLISPEKEFYNLCVKMSEVQAKDTRDILEQEPKPMKIPTEQIPYPKVPQNSPQEGSLKFKIEQKKTEIWI